uniref:Selenoprotein W n=1 Tax=Plectus sambesii TaxID=2011161 RepID=A0A914WFK0_9BILA
MALLWYKVKALKLQKQLNEEFKGVTINFTMEPTPKISGDLEVTVNGQLIHSKKNGMGYIDKPEKLQKIFDAVRAALEGK